MNFQKILIPFDHPNFFLFPLLSSSSFKCDTWWAVCSHCDRPLARFSAKSDAASMFGGALFGSIWLSSSQVRSVISSRKSNPDHKVSWQKIILFIHRQELHNNVHGIIIGMWADHAAPQERSQGSPSQGGRGWKSQPQWRTRNDARKSSRKWKNWRKNCMRAIGWSWGRASKSRNRQRKILPRPPCTTVSPCPRHPESAVETEPSDGDLEVKEADDDINEEERADGAGQKLTRAQKRRLKNQAKVVQRMNELKMDDAKPRPDILPDCGKNQAKENSGRLQF